MEVHLLCCCASTFPPIPTAFFSSRDCMCVRCCTCLLIFQYILRLARRLVGILSFYGPTSESREGLDQPRGAGTDNTTVVLPIDVSVLRLRKEQFPQAHASKPSKRRKHRRVLALKFEPFLRPISASSMRNWTQVSDQDVLDRRMMCFLHMQGAGTTVTHTSICYAFSSKPWGSSSRTTLGCAGWYANGFLEKGLIVKLKSAYSFGEARNGPSYWKRPATQRLVRSYGITLRFPTQSRKKVGSLRSKHLPCCAGSMHSPCVDAYTFVWVVSPMQRNGLPLCVL